MQPRASVIGAPHPFRFINSPGAEAQRRAHTERRLRVLLIGHQFQVNTEGLAKARALSKFGDLDLYVLTPERYREAETRWRYPEEPDGGQFHFGIAPVAAPWCGPAKWYLQWYPCLAKILRLLQPDIIDVWEEPWGLLSAQTCHLRNTHAPSARVVSETEQNVFKNLPPPFEWFRSFTFDNADFLVGRNAESLQVAQRKRFCGPSRVVGNGLDAALFKKEDRTRCRSQFGMSGFCVGYAGRLVPEKGLEVLLASIRRIKGGCSLWLSGDGPMRKKLSNEPGVFWAGALQRTELPEFYNSIDVLVLPSLTTAAWKEQFGRVLIEAQACGTPVVGSDSGAIPEVIGGNGLVFREGDAEGLAECLRKLRDDLLLRERLSIEGRRHAEALYSWDAVAAQMHGIYTELAGRKRGEKN